MIILGIRHFGRTDAVPGLFHVSTKFFHIDYLPLIPLGSYLIVDVRGPRYAQRVQQAVSIPLSGKSIGIAWLRFLAIAIAIGCLIWSIVSFTDPGNFTVPEQLVALLAFALTTALACFFMKHKWFRNASYDRAIQLCQYMGDGNTGLRRMVDRYFQEQGEFVNLSPAEAEAAFDDDHQHGALGGDQGSALPVAVPLNNDLELGKSSVRIGTTPVENKVIA